MSNKIENVEKEEVSKYQDLISCSYRIKLTPVDGKYSKPCKFYFDKDFV